MITELTEVYSSGRKNVSKRKLRDTERNVFRKSSDNQYLSYKIHIQLKYTTAFKLGEGVVKCIKVEDSFTAQEVLIVLLLIIL